MAKKIPPVVLFSIAALLFIESAISQTSQTTLLPMETVAAISILDGEQWQQRFSKTGLAQFFNDASVREYVTTVTRGAKSEAAWLRMILPGEDSVEVAGQFTYALIAAGTGFEHLVQIECKNARAAEAWVASVSARLTDQGFSKTPNNNSTPIRIYRSQAGENQVAFTIRENRALACTSPNVLRQLLSQKFQPLVRSPEYSATVSNSLQAMQQSDSNQPLFWWFVRPLQLTLTDPNDKKAADRYKLMQSQGFDAVKALGGAGTIDGKTHRLKAMGFASIQRPLQLAARMLDLSDSSMPSLPPWCRAATSCGFLNIRTDRFLENYSSLFDALYGEGETGVFQAVLEDLKRRKDGPQIDLQNELVGLLQPRAYFGTVQGETTAPRVIGIPTQHQERVAAAVKKLFEGDSRAINQSGDNHRTWKIMPLEDGYGIKEPFAISIREGFLFVAPNTAVIDYLVRNAAPLQERFGDAVGNVKFAYRIDFERFAERFLDQLKSKKLSKSSDSLLTQLKLKNAFMAADASKLPPFETVRGNFDTVLSLHGSGSGNLKITIESK